MRRLSTIMRRMAGPALLGLAEVVAAFALVVAAAPPAAAQFDFRFPFFDSRQRRQQAPGWQWQQQWPQQWPQERREAPVDYSKAPPPRKHDTAPTMNIVVLGDSMADWLAYGLEDAFGETPEMGVVRKHRANRGLIKIETRNEAYDAVAATRETLSAEKPDFVVMMIGLADRQSIRERATRAATQPGQPAANQPPANQPRAQPAPAAQPAPPVDAEAPAEDKPVVAAPESAPSGPGVTHQFRSEKWAEAYAKRIDDTIAALKAKGAPVFWVGLPAIRGTRSTSEMVYLNDLYRSRAEKAGIVYVDVWDGFVDEDGSFAAAGPDFEGQIRRLRAGDGVHFTKAGARKLAHYVEREIRRVMLARGAPVAMPVPEEKEPQQQAPGSRPGTPAARPVAGPVVPLLGQPASSEALVGGGPARGQSSDAVANRVLVKGEPTAAPAGRADNFAWPKPDALPAATAPGPEPAAEPAAATPAAAPSAGTPKPAAPAAKQPPKRPTVRNDAPLFTREDQPRPPGSIRGGGWSGWRW